MNSPEHLNAHCWRCEASFVHCLLASSSAVLQTAAHCGAYAAHRFHREARPAASKKTQSQRGPRYVHASNSIHSSWEKSKIASRMSGLTNNARYSTRLRKANAGFKCTCISSEFRAKKSGGELYWPDLARTLCVPPRKNMIISAICTRGNHVAKKCRNVGRQSILKDDSRKKFIKTSCVTIPRSTQGGIR